MPWETEGNAPIAPPHTQKTKDHGKEIADHQRFSLDTGIKVYFRDPGSPWQRGSNENTNDSTFRKAWTCRTFIEID